MERARPLLEAMGEKIVHAGEVGQGQAVKVISNSVSAINCATLAQALVVGRRADVDLEALLEVMGAGSANSTMLQLKGKPMLEHDFSPLFKLEHMLKDVAAVPRRGARRRRAVPVRGARAGALQRRRRAAASASRTSPPCSRSSRASRTRVSDTGPARAAEIGTS